MQKAGNARRCACGFSRGAAAGDTFEETGGQEGPLSSPPTSGTEFSNAAEKNQLLPIRVRGGRTRGVCWPDSFVVFVIVLADANCASRYPAKSKHLRLMPENPSAKRPNCQHERLCLLQPRIGQRFATSIPCDWVPTVSNSQ